MNRQTMKQHLAEAAAGLCAVPRTSACISLVISILIALPCATAATNAPAVDLRVRELDYSPSAVVTLPVKRGVVALVVLDDDETITELAAGLGGDCTKVDSAWCITAQPGSRHFFVKAKSHASAANNVVVVTDRRPHAFRFVVLPDDDARQPVHRVVVKAPAPPPAHLGKAMVPKTATSSPAPTPAQPGLPEQLLPLIMGLAALPNPPAGPSAPQRVADRLQHKPQALNTQYSLAEGAGAQDIVPTLVFDDGRFTYLRFAGRSELPAVFHVLPDGTETLVNARMEDELLVVDRISRRLMLRAGSAAVGIWNEAFDIEGDTTAPAPGINTTVPGVDRVLKTTSTARRALPASTGAQP